MHSHALPILLNVIILQELWEFRSSQLQNKVDKIPKLKTIIQNDPYNTVKLGESEEPFPNLSSNLYKEDMSVEEMIREIVRLQKIVNAHSET